MATKSKAVKAKKTQAIKKSQVHKNDTGTPEVQVAVLTQEINHLTEHLKSNPKDISSRRGLLRKVGKRKSLLRYLAVEDSTRYKKVVTANNLKSGI